MAAKQYSQAFTLLITWRASSLPAASTNPEAGNHNRRGMEGNMDRPPRFTSYSFLHDPRLVGWNAATVLRENERFSRFPSREQCLVFGLFSLKTTLHALYTH